MKILKLIALLILPATLCLGQNTWSAPASAGDGGQNNIFLGNNAGASTTGGANLIMGANAGRMNQGGGSNIFIGSSAGQNINGSHNTFIGRSTGANLPGGGYNVFIGSNAGSALTTNTSYKLYIETSNETNTPLIYGDFSSDKVGINTSSVPSEYTLAVNGKTITEEVQVMLPIDWPDYVFAEDYNLMPLTTLEAEIKTLGHLPGVPSAEEVEANGHALGNMDAILLEKIEELTLHLIDMNKEMKKLRERNEALETRLSEVEEK